ncbi:selenium cofactor biosynthesis protein YqeC [Shewanella marina]|uniref:selenium cofactor biosynthesis protein YqeC n=1 Tax=Shewanella marina TaxID=487319 RepID=UPI000471BE37|nr:selenium cofactor biosynthesis protein YqeC [Shewanella marina]
MISSCIFTSQLKSQLISLVGAGGKTSTAFYLANEFKKQGHKVLITTTTKMYLPNNEYIDHIISADTDINNNALKQQDELTQFTQLFSTNINITPASITFAYQACIAGSQPTKVQGLSPQMLNRIKQSQLFSIIIVEADGAHCLPLKCPADNEPCLPSQTDTVIGICSTELFQLVINPNKIHRWPRFAEVTRCTDGELLTISILQRLVTDSQGLFKSAPAHATRIWLLNKTDICPDIALLKQQVSQLSLAKLGLTEIWLSQLLDQPPRCHITVNK